MKKLLITVAVVALGATSAQAADIAARPYTKAPVAVPGVNWTGFYLGAGGGYGLWEADQYTGDVVANSPISSTQRLGGRGYFGTVSGGYDWQIAPSWVVGIFADAQFGDIKGTISDPATPASGPLKNNLNYAAGLRVGYLVAPNVLSYVNGGYSHAEFKGATLGSAFGGSPLGTTAKFTADGWFIGGGVENTLDFFGINAPGWFVKTEYRVAQYNREVTGLTFTGNTAPSRFINVTPYVQTVGTSLVYKFNWGNTGAQTAVSPRYANAPAAMSANWTGFYLGAGGGYGLWNADQATTFATPTTTQRLGGRGYFGTVSGGYDWQVSPSWVVGVFADAQFGDIKGTIADPDNSASGPLKNDLNYAAGLRVGYLVAPNVLTYINGGYSHAEFKSATLSDSVSNTPVATTPKLTADGWFIGGGVENTLDFFGINAPGWFVKTEYRMADYNRRSVVATPIGGGPVTNIDVKPYVQTIGMSLVYRFNWGGPVVAKY